MSAEALLNKIMNTPAIQNDEEFNTEYALCPELDSAFGTVKDWKFTNGTWVDQEGKERIWANLQLRWEIDSDEARASMKKDIVIVPQTIMLSITENGELDKDNNQQFARLMKLFSIKPSEHANLFDAFKHQNGWVKVAHRALQNKAKEPLLDDEGNQRYVAEVVAVSLQQAA